MEDRCALPGLLLLSPWIVLRVRLSRGLVKHQAEVRSQTHSGPSGEAPSRVIARLVVNAFQISFKDCSIPVFRRHPPECLHCCLNRGAASPEFDAQFLSDHTKTND